MIATCRFCDDFLTTTLCECDVCRLAAKGKETMMSTPPAPIYIGAPPETCQLCHAKITDEFVDGKTKLGFWANMCVRCHRSSGVGLGTGKGQKYKRTGGEYQKIDG